MNTKALVAAAALLAPAVALAQDATAPKYTVAAVANGGRLAGAVKFKGAAPKAGTLPVTKDQAVCHATVPDETVTVGKEGGLANVLVYFTDVKTGKDPKTLPPAVLENKDCRFVPHVQAVMVGTDLIVTNEDPILHNSHAYLGEATIFNRALPTQGMKQPVKVKKPGVMHVKCDAGHTWMSSYVVGVENPYFAVTGEDGKFTIADIPPGTYTVKVWHEKFGEQQQKVTIAAGQGATLDLTMGG
jgi:plastocyanin